MTEILFATQAQIATLQGTINGFATSFTTVTLNVTGQYQFNGAPVTFPTGTVVQVGQTVSGTAGANNVTEVSFANTGFTNSFIMDNAGTVSNAATIASVGVSLSGTANSTVSLNATGGATPTASLSVGTAFTGGLTITAASGITMASATNFTSTFKISGNAITFPAAACSVLAAGQSVTTGTGSANTTKVTSTNTGFTNALTVGNNGTSSNAATIASHIASLDAVANGTVSLSAVGGASPSATLSSGSGLTGGFTISAGAGNLTLSGTVALSSVTSTLLKVNGSSVVVAAVASTDYAPATSGTAILKGNNTGGFANATAGTDYMAPGTTSLITVGFTITPSNQGTVSSGTFTPAAANGNYQYYTNNGAHTLAAPAADCAIDILVTNGASAGAITFSGFTVGSNTGDAYATTNANKYILSIRRINSISTYIWKALQ